MNVDLLMMKPGEAKAEFERFVAESGAVVSEFKPIDAIRLMLDFYLQERAEGCDVKADEDMLLFQWGTHEWGKQGRFFEFSLARQLTDNEAEEGEQTTLLSLTCYFPPTAELEALKTGSKWCASPDELAGFEYYIGNTPAYKAVGKLRPENVALTCGPV
jgi:hypothetical protein